MKFRVSLASTVGQNILTDIKSGSGTNPVLELYTGSEPSTMGSPITDTLLAVFDLGATVGTESNGVVTLSGWADEDAAPNGGQAGWGRILNQSGEEIIYLTATDGQGGGPIKVNPQSVTQGDPVVLTSASFRLPT